MPPNVTTNFVGGANVAQEFATPAVVSSNSTVTLVWRASEGGQYVVETSTDLENWSVLSNGINATLNVAYASAVLTTQEFYRVTRTNLAIYEP